MRLLTITDVALSVGQRPHVVDYAVKTHGPEPTTRVANIRLWAESELEGVKESLRKVAKTRQGRPHARAN